jgi:hypothetical protein
MTKSLLKKIVVTCVFLGLASGTAFAGVFLNRTGRVEAFDTVVWNFWNLGSESLVVVDGDGDTDLDCYVYDAATNRLLGSDTDGTDYCVIPVYHPSGRIRLEIDNLGPVWNAYQIRIR